MSAIPGVIHGFTMEVHAGVRRAWPPSFIKFISNSLDDGTPKVEDVMKTYNISQSLVYKWRASANGSACFPAAIAGSA